MDTTQQQKKGPLSPLRTGCAFIMLTNMLIYMAVMAFVLNMLDPSKLDPDYLARRGFTTQKKETDQERAFRMMAEDRYEELRKVTELSLAEPMPEPSPAEKLSKLSRRKLPVRPIEEPTLPTASITYDVTQSHLGYKGSSRSRIYSTTIYPKVSLRPSYIIPKTASTRNILPERYDTITVELAPGIALQPFSIRIPNTDGNATYTPPDPIPSGARGGLKLTAPSKGAESTETGQTAEESGGAKDDL